MKRNFVIIVWLFLFCSVCQAQFDPQISQNMFNIPAVNPAAIAQDSSFTVYGIMRQQWVGLTRAPKTAIINLNAPFLTFSKAQHAGGLMYFNDRAGFFQNQMLYGQYSYRYRLRSDGVLSFGAMIGALNQTVNPEVFIPKTLEGTSGESGNPAGGLGGANDIAILQEKGNGIALDLGAGVFYSDSRKYVGISAQHLSRSKRKMDENIDYSTKVATYFTAGYNFSLANPFYTLKPSVFVKTDYVSVQADFDVLIDYRKKYWGGIGYRLEDALVFILGLDVGSGIRVSYSYDWTTSKLSRVSNGSHEISVGYSFKQENKKIKYKSIRIL